MEITIGIVDSYLKLPLLSSLENGDFERLGHCVRVKDDFSDPQEIFEAIDQASIDVGFAPITLAIRDALVSDSVIVKGVLNLRHQYRFFVRESSVVSMRQLPQARCVTTPDCVTDLRLAATAMGFKLSKIRRSVLPNFANSARQLLEGDADVLFSNSLTNQSITEFKSLQVLQATTPEYPSLVASVFPRVNRSIASAILDVLKTVEAAYESYFQHDSAVQHLQDYLSVTPATSARIAANMIPIRGFAPPNERSLRWLLDTLPKFGDCPSASTTAESDVWMDLRKMAS